MTFHSFRSSFACSSMFPYSHCVKVDSWHFDFRPDINAIKGLASASSSGAAKVVPPSAVNRVAAEDRELARQGSLVDGESIKIVIHHADNDMSKYLSVESLVKLCLLYHPEAVSRDFHCSLCSAWGALSANNNFDIYLAASRRSFARILSLNMVDTKEIKGVTFSWY